MNTVAKVIGFLLLCGIFVGIGVGIGYAAFHEKALVTNCLPCNQSMATTTGKPAVSTAATTAGVTTTIRPTNPPALQSTTTVEPPPPASQSTTTVESPPPADICPPSLPDPSTTQLILTLDQTNAPTSTFQKYSFQYLAPSSVTTAMLTFEFITSWGSWYLDDVSIKRADGTGTQLIDNGGFEAGNLGSKWKYCDTRYSWIREGTVVSHTKQSGMYSYESQDTGFGSDEYLTQIWSVQSNQRYTVEFYLLLNGDQASVKVTLAAG